MRRNCGLILARADLRSRLVPVLMLLAETLYTTGNPTAAFDITRRVLLFQPGHPEARRLAWELAVLTGQRDVMFALEQVRSFRDATEKFPVQALNTMPLKQGKLVQSLFEAETALLAPHLRKVLMKLSVFPAPFPAEMAEAVCGASLSVLQALEKTPFVQKSGDAYCLPPLVQECAWKQVATSARRQLRKHLAEFCIKGLRSSQTPENAAPFPLDRADRERPFLRLTLEWVMEQVPILSYLTFIDQLRHCGFSDLALLAISYLQKIEATAFYPMWLRVDAGLGIAFILMHVDDNAGAVHSLESGLSLLNASTDLSQKTSLYVTLMRAYSNIGEWALASQRGTEALECTRQVGNTRAEVHCIRFLGEISFYAGDLPQALLLCEEALERGRDLSPEWECIPDALYWRARILSRMQRWEEALDAIEKALSLWEEAGDTKVGLCLCVMGQIRMEMRRYAEARMHLEHAINLHQRSAREGHRIAAVEALGDLFCTVHKFSEAHALYTECLVYHQTKSYPTAIERLDKKLRTNA